MGAALREETTLREVKAERKLRTKNPSKVERIAVSPDDLNHADFLRRWPGVEWLRAHYLAYLLFAVGVLWPIPLPGIS